MSSATSRVVPLLESATRSSDGSPQALHVPRRPASATGSEDQLGAATSVPSPTPRSHGSRRNSKLRPLPDLLNFSHPAINLSKAVNASATDSTHASQVVDDAEALGQVSRACCKCMCRRLLQVNRAVGARRFHEACWRRIQQRLGYHGRSRKRETQSREGHPPRVIGPASLGRNHSDPCGVHGHCHSLSVRF